MVAINAPADLSTDLERLARSLENLVFPEIPGEVGLGAARDRLVRAIRSYLLPRIEDPPGPLLVVFAGPTGAGKSTLLNSLSGIEVSETGPLRPTTREPVVLAADPTRYETIGGLGCVTVGGAAPILTSMSFADTPDIDSTSSRHRAVSEIMIDHADIVVFVSSAMRYGDLVPWEVLRRARSRGAPLLVVLNRVSTGSGAAVADFRRLLEQESVDGEVLVVHEHHLGADAAIVPSVAVRSLRRRLMAEVTKHGEQRDEIMKSVLWSTLGEAGDLIAQADLAVADRELVSEIIDERFTPGLERLLLELPDLGDHRLDLDAITTLRRFSKRRVRRRLRRIAPSQQQIAATRRWLDAALTAALEADLRAAVEESLRAMGEPDGRRAGNEVRQSTHDAITSWSSGLGALAGGNDPGFTALLIEMAVLQVGGARDALEALVGDDCEQTLVRAKTALTDALLPAYGAMRDWLTSEVADEVTARPVVDEARAALSEAVALSAFANA